MKICQLSKKPTPVGDEKECWLCQLRCKRVEAALQYQQGAGAIRELRTIYREELRFIETPLYQQGAGAIRELIGKNSFIETNCQSNAASPNQQHFLSNGQKKNLSFSIQDPSVSMFK